MFGVVIMVTLERMHQKPSKPYPTFPLTAHNNGQWCKKIRGKIYFFGVWQEPQIAHQNYLRVAEDLHAGRQLERILSPDQMTVKDICNHYLTYQLHKVDAGEISARTFDDYRRVANSFVRFIGPSKAVEDIAPEDFQKYRKKLTGEGLTGKGKGQGIYALNRSLTIVKTILKYGYEMDLIEKPVKYGMSFEKPSMTLRRKSQHAKELESGKRLFSADEIRAILKAAGAQLRAMVLLAINGGLGNNDCAKLPMNVVDYENAVIYFNRPKTGIERVVPLWPETMEALLQALRNRPKPTKKEWENLVFLTTFGSPWVQEKVHRSSSSGIEKVVNMDAIGHEFEKVLTKLNIKRKGVGFYSLRHTFRTWADEINDQHAIHRIMGHTIPGMAGIYVEKIDLNRLRAVVDHVRDKLFSHEPQTAAGAI
jgi:integrase